MSKLAQLIFGNLINGMIAHKPSTGIGAAAIATAATIPSFGESGNIVMPSTLEEGIAQVVFALIGVVLFYFKPKQ